MAGDTPADATDASPTDSHPEQRTEHSTNEQSSPPTATSSATTPSGTSTASTPTPPSPAAQVDSPGWIRRLIGACWRHPGVTLGSLLASVLGVGLEAVGPLLTKIAVDNAVAGVTAGLVGLVAAMAGLAVVRLVAAFFRRYLGGRLSLDVQHDLRRAVFAAVQRLDGPKQDSLRTGQVVSRAISDLQLVQGLLGMVPLVVGTVVLLLASIAAMLWLSPLLTLIALIMLPAAVLITARTRRTLFPATWSAQQRAADVAQHVEETVTGVRVVKGFGQEAREVASLERSALRLYGERLRAARLTARLAPPLAALPALGLVAVFGLGGLLALRGQISIGTFLAFSTYVGNLVGPARMIGSLVVSAQLARAGVERVYELIESQPEVADPPNPAQLPPGPLAVRLDGVRFGYTRDDPVLDDVSLSVAPGETVALVGSAGSGKSTVAMLLPRFYDPQEGEIRVGDVPLRDLPLATLRRELGVVFEEAFLFSDTIRANIAYGRPDATDAEVRAAARAAQVEEFVSVLPEDFDTMVGERGLTLSGGQRQRIALARALLTNPRILLLDDATSAVDATTEAAIHATLRQVTATRTTILIAHRRSTLALADRIVVLDGGRVLDVGTERELAERGTLTLLGNECGTGHAGHDPDALWPDPPAGSAEASAATGARTSDAVAGGPGGATGMIGNLPPTPELLARVNALPEPTDRPELGPEGNQVDPTAPDPGFALRRLLRPVRMLLALSVLLVGADAAASVAYPSLARLAVDGGIIGQAPAVLAMAAGLGLLVVAANWLAAWAQTLVTARAGESVLYLLRVRSYAHLQRLGLDYYERELAGRIMTRMTTDVDALSTFLQTGLVQAVVSLLTVLGVSVALLLTDIGLAGIALAAMPVLILATVVFRRRSSVAYADARERVSLVNADLQENMSGLRVSQAFVREEYSAAEFGARSAAYRVSRLRAQRYIAMYFPFVTALSELSQAAVLAAGASRVAAGDLSPGVLTAFLLYLAMFFAPVQQLSQVFDGYQQAKVGLSRIGDLLRTPTSVPDAGSETGADLVEVPDRLRGEVELDAVRFRYPGTDRDAVRELSLLIRPGETVALVGSTGAGKSTVVKLLGRFYDVTEGQVRVDEVDLRRYPLGRYRRRLGVVPQEAHLFTGDVASNIAYGRPDASPARIEAAARAVGALDMIAGLPAGFRQPVGERGQGLSAGQRQLVALARAELVDPDLLLLDEATAALDPATEAAVLAASDRLAGRGTDGAGPRRRRTTVLVAHRLATAARADRIVVLADGRVVEQGSHPELLAQNGRYAAFWRAGNGELDEPTAELGRSAAELDEPEASAASRR
ncbi:MAG TPA: ABC transporter ATP-binding protein [Pseudonocardia sp.]|uniref:ABC transporter ATP-binding protein n=1 Tax=Pseudonocardia sp. TaxID=60912 RepID=UPI002C163344|nr:ABC transporter ATP-binding protein [Pseudonocardia sp.]HTF46821.1 ABC transporter ATP-binding protein [Pseudonocardia sp.]